jgi:hypothetical protein
MIRSVSSIGQILILSSRPWRLGYRRLLVDLPPYHSSSAAQSVPGNWWPHHADIDISMDRHGQISLTHSGIMHARLAPQYSYCMQSESKVVAGAACSISSLSQSEIPLADTGKSSR